MWISAPTPVISRTKTADRGSNKIPAWTSRDPLLMKVNRWRPTDRWSRPASCTVQNRRITNATITVRVPSRWPQRSVRRPPSSSTAAPARGSAMSSQEALRSPVAGTVSMVREVPVRSVLQQVDVVDGGGAAGPVDAHDDRQPDHDLGRGDDHDEERDELAVDRARGPGEGDQGQVHRVEHQLDAHEHDDRVAPHQHADGADGEQDRGQHQVVGDGHRGAASPLPGTGPVVPRPRVPRAASGPPAWPRPSRSAPGEPAGGSSSTSWGCTPVLKLAGDGLPSGSRPGAAIELARA